MALQIDVTTQNAILDAIETSIGVSAVLKVRSGAPPASCASADAGVALAVMSLPSDYMSSASGDSKAKLGTWQDTSADASGTAGHFRLYQSDGVTCRMQGTITATGGGGDMTIDSTSITAGQQVTITGFTLAAANS